MQAISDDEKKILAQRLRSLMRSESLTQKQIAEESQLDQPFISRILNCDYRRRSERVIAISDYVNMRAMGVRVPPEATAAIAGYITCGGRVDLLCEAIRLLTNAQVSRKS